MAQVKGAPLGGLALVVRGWFEQSIDINSDEGADARVAFEFIIRVEVETLGDESTTERSPHLLGGIVLGIADERRENRLIHGSVSKRDREGALDTGAAGAVLVRE